MLDFNLFLINNVEDIFVFLVLKTAIEIRKALFFREKYGYLIRSSSENMRI